jgi:hypothetical protein
LNGKRFSVNKFPAFHGYCTSITVFTGACSEPIEASTYPHTLIIYDTVRYCPPIYVCLPIFLYFSGCPAKVMLYAMALAYILLDHECCFTVSRVTGHVQEYIHSSWQKQNLSALVHVLSLGYHNIETSAGCLSV